MGAVVLGAMLIYLLISIGVIKWAIHYARKHGKSTNCWGWGAALVMFLVPFWDWIPTVAMHKYACKKEAGLWVYKTVDEWKTENPSVMEKLVAYKGEPPTRQGDMQNYIDTYYLNERFNWVIKHNGKFLFNLWRHEQEIVDVKHNTIMARYVDFSTSQERQQAGWSGWKFWLENEHCNDGVYNQDALRNYRNNFIGEYK